MLPRGPDAGGMSKRRPIPGGNTLPASVYPHRLGP